MGTPRDKTAQMVGRSVARSGGFARAAGFAAGPGLAVMLVVALACGLRCYRLGAAALSNDEAFSWRLSQYAAADLLGHAAGDVHPPLYYLLLRGWSAVAGTTPAALRGFSVIWGSAAVGLLYLLCLEAHTTLGCDSRLSSSAGPQAPRGRLRGGAVFGALLLAVWVGQVKQGQNARMYSLGVFMACLTAWLLLRASRAARRWIAWWTAYGLAAAAFCGIHYYAFFTLAAQALFLLGLALRRGSSPGLGKGWPLVGWFGFAALLALIWYSPWLPVFWRQAWTVHASYWIPRVTLAEVERIFVSWSLGLDATPDWEGRLGEVFVAAGLLWLAVRGGAVAWFFLLQAGLPWILSLGLSVTTGRSIFLEHYLAFAQLGLMGLASVLWNRLRAIPERLVMAGFLLATAVCGLEPYLDNRPTDPPALAQAALFLREHYQPGDAIVTDAPAAVNRLRYYCQQAGIENLTVRCGAQALGTGGHVTHLASLDWSELQASNTASDAWIPSRLWWAGDGDGFGGAPPGGWSLAGEQSFTDGGPSRYTLRWYERKPP